MLWLTVLFSANSQTGCKTVIKDGMLCLDGDCAKKALLAFAQRDSLRADVKDYKAIIAAKDSINIVLSDKLQKVEAQSRRKNIYKYLIAAAFLLGVLL